MSICNRAQDLFGAYWDDETTQAEREWLEGHFASCSGCRESYEQLARTLEAVAELPRAEVAPGLAERALAAARRTNPTPDRIFVRETPTWIPVTAAAAAALLMVFTVLLFLTQSKRTNEFAGGPQHVAPEPFVVPHHAPMPGNPATPPDTNNVAGGDSILNHTEDMDFVLDPVQLRRGHVHTTHLPSGVQGEQAVISY